MLCLGSIVVDISIQGLERFPTPGSEFTEASDIWHSEPARLLLAGTAGNSAVVFAALTGSCDLAGPVGNDALGEFLETGFSRRGVRLIGAASGSTATHVIANGVDGRRESYFHPGMSLDLPRVLASWDGGNVLITGIPLVMRRPRIAGMRHVLERAHAVGGRAVLELGQANEDPWRLDEITELGNEIDLLMGSTREFDVLLGTSLADGLPRLRDAFAGPVVLKRGALGAVVHDGGREEVVPATQVRAVNPVGAGDAFAAGFMAAWLGGRSVVDATRFACAVGAVSVATPEGPQGVTPGAVEHLFDG